ncbi:hypothetical protein DYH09_14205 [bacterium CPR1]|nr:hypothetical protein [bacterium CPR1]
MRNLLLIFLFGCLLAVGSPAQPRADLENVALLTRFLTDGPLSSQDLQILAAELQSDYARDPEGAARSAREVQELLKAIAGLKNPVELGAVRQRLLGEFYLSQSQGQQSPTVGLILSRVQPLAFDPQERLLLTRSDLQAALEYVSFLGQLQGGAGLSSAQAELIAAQVVSNFSRLSPNEKAFLASARLMWTLVAQNWQRMSAQQQSAWRQQYTPPTPAAAPAGGIDPSVYRLMSQMSLQSHATTMNIIENMGGTGDYWQVVPQDY